MAVDDAALITTLTTYHAELPQGAPTSSAILSLVLRSVDDALTAAAARHGVVYTRYVDDIFVSGNRPLHFFTRIVRQAVAQARFTIRETKLRQWGPTRRATLAGIVIGSHPTIDPQYVEGVRRLLHQVRRGVEPCTAKQLASLAGKIAWIAQLRPAAGRRLEAELGAIREQLAPTSQRPILPSAALLHIAHGPTQSQ
jgi:hypothetical protein